MANYRDLVVTMRIRLDQSGRIIGEPELVAPSAGSTAMEFAVKQARKALIKAQPYKLPASKYGRWKVIEVTFRPGAGVSM